MRLIGAVFTQKGYAIVTRVVQLLCPARRMWKHEELVVRMEDCLFFTIRHLECWLADDTPTWNHGGSCEIAGIVKSNVLHTEEKQRFGGAEVMEQDHQLFELSGRRELASKWEQVDSAGGEVQRMSG